MRVRALTFCNVEHLEAFVAQRTDGRGTMDGDYANCFQSPEDKARHALECLIVGHCPLCAAPVGSTLHSRPLPKWTIPVNPTWNLGG